MLLRRISGTFVVRGFAAFGSLALAAAIIRIFSLDRFGEYGFSLATARLIAPLALFSLDTMLLRMLLRMRTRGIDNLRERILTETAGPSVILSLASFTVVLVSSLALYVFAGGNSFWISLALTSPIILLQNMTLMQAAILRSDKRDYESQLVSMALPTFVALALVSLGWLIDSPPIYLPELATLLGMVLGAVLGWRFTGYGSLLEQLRSARSCSFQRLRLMRYASGIHVANIMNYVTEWYGGFILAATQTFAAVGAIRVYQQFARAVMLVASSVEMPFATELAQSYMKRDVASIWRMLFLSQIILGLAGISLFAGFYFFSHIIFEIYDLDFETVSTSFFIFIGLVCSRLLNGAASSALAVMDSKTELIKASFYSLVVGLVLLTALVPYFGLNGAAIALGLQFLLQGAIYYAYLIVALRRL